MTKLVALSYKTERGQRLDTDAVAPGTRPQGVPIEQASDYVRRMFDRIAPRYDLANHVLSLSIDRYWRGRAVRVLRRLLRQPQVRIVDVCCGTGDLALALARRRAAACATAGTPLHASAADVVGIDFSHAMLVRATQKSEHERLRAGWIEADALQLPQADASADAVTTGFGFRNLADYRAGLREFLRVLRPGGTLLILEFSEPTLPIVGTIYRWYFHAVLPRLGGWIAGAPEAYSYLPSSVSRFPNPQELALWMKQEGFVEVRYRRLTGGIAVLHVGRKPA